MPTPDLDADSFRDLARRSLLAEASTAIFDPRSGKVWGASDFDLNPEMLADFEVMAPARPAAVLIPVVARDTLTVLLTQRNAALTSHAGQISFPGGRLDAGETATEAALREAWEEVGLARDRIEPLGFIDSYRTGTGYLVAPIVALVHPPFDLRLNPAEVDEVFEVPLAFLLDPANHQRAEREWRGRRRSFYAMPYGERYIWGATAGMIKTLHLRLFG